MGPLKLMRPGRLILPAALLAGAIVPGCGDGKPYQDTSLTEATVSGVVTAKGAPVTEGGTINFNPSNSGRHVPTRGAPIGPDGRYTIKTYTGDNAVTYEGEIAKKHRGLALKRDYASVQSGENTIDFDIVDGPKNANMDFSKMQKKRR
jgi:hypothetical protein